MLFFIFALIIVSVSSSIYVALPLFVRKTAEIGEKRSQTFAARMERVVMKADIQKLSRLYVIAPLMFGAAGYFFTPAEYRLAGLGVGVVLGFLGPSVYIKILIQKRKDKFKDQLIDALMIMSSSFRGGLSLIQAMEAVVEEMPDPISMEVGTVLNENKMGVSLEEALNHLYERMPLPALQQTITAILLARETGGNLPLIFTKIVQTIREQNKIQQNIDTLTIQGKLQGVVMILLPIVFACVVYSTNPRFLDNMTNTDLGRKLLAYAVFSEIVGGYLIWKISTFKDY